MDKKYKIALVIKTEGLEYDDRVRKEILTVMKLYPNIDFKIFAMLPDNKEYEGMTSYGVPFKAIYMPSREKYPSAKKILKKTYEFYKVVKKDLNEFDAVWCGDYHSVAIALFYRKKPVLWDLHELPTMLSGNFVKKWVLRRVFDNCRIVVHANPQRIHYLETIGCIKDKGKHIALRNYPNFQDVDNNYDELYDAFIHWKNDRPCIYLQGLSDSSRADRETIDSVLSSQGLVAVVVGGVQSELKQYLYNKWGRTIIENRVFFVGKVPQLKIPQYVSECIATLVFYKNVRPNNYYCEANRFYQAVILGLPVVVGNNPTMSELVNKYDYGVVVDTDGSNVDKIISGLQQVIINRKHYVDAIKKNQYVLTWDKQENIIKEIVKRLIA